MKKFRILKFKSKPILDIKGISKSYDKKRILTNLELKIGPGTICGLLGPNGSGKTTLMNCILGVIKPDSGEIRVNGKLINSLPCHKRSSDFKIAYIPQFESHFRGLNVEDNLRAIAEISIKKKEEIDKIVNNLLSEFNLSDLRNINSDHLSGGERRRMIVARCLVNNPKLILCDEPFSALDPLSIDKIKEIFVALHPRGISLLISDHAYRNILEISDQTFLLSDGHIIARGSPREIIQNETAKKIYFGETQY